MDKFKSTDVVCDDSGAARAGGPALEAKVVIGEGALVAKRGPYGFVAEKSADGWNWTLDGPCGRVLFGTRTLNGSARSQTLEKSVRMALEGNPNDGRFLASSIRAGRPADVASALVGGFAPLPCDVFERLDADDSGGEPGFAWAARMMIAFGARASREVGLKASAKGLHAALVEGLALPPKNGPGLDQVGFFGKVIKSETGDGRCLAYALECAESFGERGVSGGGAVISCPSFNQAVSDLLSTALDDGSLRAGLRASTMLGPGDFLVVMGAVAATGMGLSGGRELFNALTKRTRAMALALSSDVRNGAFFGFAGKDFLRKVSSSRLLGVSSQDVEESARFAGVLCCAKDWEGALHWLSQTKGNAGMNSSKLGVLSVGAALLAGVSPGCGVWKRFDLSREAAVFLEEAEMQEYTKVAGPGKEGSKEVKKAPGL